MYDLRRMAAGFCFGSGAGLHMAALEMTAAGLLVVAIGGVLAMSHRLFPL